MKTIITKYINDELNKDQVIEFEKKMKSDPDLAKEVEVLLNAHHSKIQIQKNIQKKDALDILPEQFLKGISQTDFGDKATIRKVSVAFLIIMVALISLGYLMKS